MYEKWGEDMDWGIGNEVGGVEGKYGNGVSCEEVFDLVEDLK